MNRAFVAVFGIAVFATILLGSLALDSAMAEKLPNVTICHVDPDGDGPGPETLSVNAHSQAKHLAHGDHLGACNVCGDGIVEGEEVCDGSNLNGMTCFDLLFENGGTLSCDSTCEFNTMLCVEE